MYHFIENIAMLFNKINVDKFKYRRVLRQSD